MPDETAPHPTASSPGPSGSDESLGDLGRRLEEQRALLDQKMAELRSRSQATSQPTLIDPIGDRPLARQRAERWHSIFWLLAILSLAGAVLGLIQGDPATFLVGLGGFLGLLPVIAILSVMRAVFAAGRH